MPDIGRFAVIDPMADFVNYQSPYVISDNNPVLNVDEYGLGILNVIGNLFRRLKNGIVGIACNSCNPQREKQTIGEAWREPDFGWYESSKGSSRRYEKNDNSGGEPRKPIEGINLEPIGITKRDNGIESPVINIPTDKSNSITDLFTRDRDKKGAAVDINVGFQKNASVLDDPSGQKVLLDLVKTLAEYSQIQVLILGNASFSPEKYNKKTKTRVDGTLRTIGDLQLSRANAIKNFLIEQGVDVKRLSIGNGVINSGSTSASIQVKQ